jgi:membrane protein
LKGDRVSTNVNEAGAVEAGDTAGNPPPGRWKVWYEQSAVHDFLVKLDHLDFGNQIILFGAALILSVLPIIILLSGLASTRVDDDIARNMSLNRRGAHDVSQLFTSSHHSFNLGILIALAMSLAGTVAVGISIQEVYEKSFGQVHVKSARNVARCFIWLAIVGCLLIADANVSKALEHSTIGRGLEWALDITVLILFFWWSMHFLLKGQVAWRRLFPAAIATAIFWIGFGLFSSIYFSGSITSDDKLYGPVGIMFDLMTWFIAVGAVIILGAVSGVVWTQRRHADHDATPASNDTTMAEL